MLDTGYLKNDALKGGKLGPYAFSQSRVIWSNIQIKCNGNYYFILIDYEVKIPWESLKRQKTEEN